MAKSFFVDLTRCTACRGCQVACKQWNKLPAVETVQSGTYQNPADLSYDTYRVVRFSEKTVDKKFKWLFFPEQCRHCLIAPCKEVADAYVQGAIVRDDEIGAIIHTPESAKLTDKQRKDVREACPYDIPRWDKASGVLRKCTMCNDRVHAGLKPACVQTCPTGTMNFGEREDMLSLAKQRLAVVQKTRPKAILVNPDDVSVIYLAESDPKLYYKYLMADGFLPGPMSRKQFFAKLLAPVRAAV
jgi:formate dehydrogenase iron-sulfur subunit